MRAGSGILLVALGLFLIYLGATGKLTSLGDAFNVLMGKAKASSTVAEAPAPNTGFPVSPGVLSSLSELMGAGNAAQAAGLQGGGAAASTSYLAMA